MRFVFSALVILAAPITANAQSKLDKDWQFTLGAGGFIEPDYEGSNNYDVNPMPLVEINWRDRVVLTTRGMAGPGIEVYPFRGEFAGDNEWWIGAAAGYGFGRDEKDNPVLRGLGDLNFGVTAALAAGIEIGPVDFELSVLRDVGGDRKGTTVTFGGEIDFPVIQRRLMASIGAEVSWADGNYMQKSFGITEEQRRRSNQLTRYNLTQYSAGSGFKDAEITTGLTLAITDHWRIISRASYTYLFDGAGDSPLVNRYGSRSQLFGAIGLSYSW